MKKKIVYMLTALLVATSALLTSCDKTGSLVISYNEESVSAYGGDVELTIQSKGNWTITILEAGDWFSVAPMSGTGDGTAIVKIDPNNTSRAKKIKLRITDSNGSKDITITQPAVEVPYIEVKNLPEGEIDASGGTFTIDIISNAQWSLTKDSGITWITIAETSGTGNAKVELKITPNVSDKQRKVELKAEVNGLSPVKFTIAQSANAQIDFTIDDLVGTWQATGFVIYFAPDEIYGEKLAAKPLDYEVTFTKKDATTMTISNFGGGIVVDNIKVNATIDVGNKTLTIPFQQLTPAWDTGFNTFLSSYDAVSTSGSNTTGKDMPASTIDATKAKITIELKSANLTSPSQMMYALPNLAETQFYSCYIYDVNATSGTYEFWYVIYVDLTFTKMAN